MEISSWQSLIGDIHEEFYTVLVGTADCGPFDGRCVVVALALQRVIGGDIMVIVRPDNTADHAVVSKDGLLWDFDGPLTPEEFIERFNETELIGMPWKCVGFRTIQEGDLNEAYRGPALEDQLAELFQRALNNPGNTVNL